MTPERFLWTSPVSIQSYSIIRVVPCFALEEKFCFTIVVVDGGSCGFVRDAILR